MPLSRRETPAPVPHASSGGPHALPSALTGVPRTHAATACAGCGETIMAFEPYFAFDTMVYHQKCFKCSRCHRPLAMDNVLAFNGDIFCTKHNPAAGPPPAPSSSASTAKRFFFRRPASFLTKSSSTVTNPPPPPPSVPAPLPRHVETVVSPTLSSASAHVHWDPEATYAAPFTQITRRLSPVATDRAAAPPSITGVSPSITGVSPPGRATPGSTHTSSISSSSSLSWSRRYQTHAAAATAAAAAEPAGLPTVVPLSTSRPTSPLSQPWDDDDHVPHPRMNVEDDTHPPGLPQARARAGSASNLRSRFPSAASVSAVSLISMFQKSGGTGGGKDAPAPPEPYPDYEDDEDDEDDDVHGDDNEDEDEDEDHDHDDDDHRHRRRHRHSHHPHLARADTLPSPPVDARYTPPNTYAPSALAASSLVGAVGTSSAGTRLPDTCPTPPDPSPGASPRAPSSAGGDFKRLPPRSTSFAFGTAPGAHTHARTLLGVDEGDDDDENEYDTSAVPVAGDDSNLPPRPPRDPDHVLARHLARMALGHPGPAGVHGADPAALTASSPTRATIGIVARRSITRSRSQDLDVVGDEVAAAVVAAPQRRAQFTHLKKQRAQSMGAVASIWTAGAAPALPDLIYRTDGFVVETPPPRAVPIFGVAPASAPLAGPPQEDWGLAVSARPPPLPTSPQIAHEFVSSAASVASVHSNGGGSVVSQATAAAAGSVSGRSPHASVRSRGTNPYLVSDARLNAMLVDYAHVEYSPYPGAPPTLLDQVDVTAMYYRQYFAGHDHNNYVMVLDGAQGGSSGVAGAISAAMSMGGGGGSGNAASALDDGLTGPLVISVRHDVAAGIFRMLVRSEDRDVRIEVPVSEVKARVKRHKDVIKYVYQRFPVHKLVKVRAKSLESDLVKLDQMRLAFGVKVGVLYMRRGQTDENAVFGNPTHSRAFDEFLDVLGDRVPLVGYQGFLGGLDNRHGLDGPESVVGKCGHFDLMFHVSTLLPYSRTDPQQVQRKAKIGNDLVCVVYVDDFAPPPASAGEDAHHDAALADLAQVTPVFDPTMIQSHFLTVYLVVAPCVMDGVAGHRVAVVAQADVPSFGPPLPPDGFFGDATQLRHFLHAKLVNGEAAAFRAGKIARLHRRTREMMVRDLVTTLVKYGGYDKPNAAKNAKDDSCGDVSDAAAAANASPQPTRGSRGRGAMSEKPGDAAGLPVPPSTSRRGKSRFRTQTRQSVAPGAGDLASLENPSAVTVAFPAEPADAVTSPTLATAVPATAPPVGSPPRPRGRGFFAAMLRRNPGAGNSASASPPAPTHASFVPDSQQDGGGAA